MPSRRRLVVLAAKAALEASTAPGGFTKPDGLTVEVMRTRPIEAGNLPALIIVLPEESIAYQWVNQANRDLTIWIEARVTDQGEDPDEALDAVLEWCERALMADVHLGGLSDDINPAGIRWDIEQTLNGAVAAQLAVRITYDTSYKDPGSAG